MFTYFFSVKFRFENEFENFGKFVSSLNPSLRIAVGSAIVNTMISEFENKAFLRTLRRFLFYFFSNNNIQIFLSFELNALLEFCYHKFLDEINTETGIEWLDLLQDLLNLDSSSKKSRLVQTIKVEIVDILKEKKDQIDLTYCQKLEDLLIIF